MKLIPAAVGGNVGTDSGAAFRGFALFAPAFLAYGETSFDVNEAKWRTPLPPTRAERLALIAPDDDGMVCADDDTDTADRLLPESTSFEFRFLLFRRRRFRPVDAASVNAVTVAIGLALSDAAVSIAEEAAALVAVREAALALAAGAAVVVGGMTMASGS
jgi:hypothetical protein